MAEGSRRPITLSAAPRLAAGGRRRGPTEIKEKESGSLRIFGKSN